MSVTQKPLYDFHLVDIIKVFIIFKKTILSATIIALIGSIIVAMILPVYFESKTIIYPNNLTLADKSSIFGQQQNQSEFSYYGNKFDANRILSFANSSTVIDYIINKYDLVSHYGYDKNEAFVFTKTKEDFLKNYAAFKNDRDAIEIILLDTDKDLCAKMVNDIADKIDRLSIEPIKENRLKIVKMLEKEITEKMTNPAKSSDLADELKSLNKSLTEYKVSTNDNISAITILEKAFPAEKKSKPIRWVIVLLSTLGTFFAALLISILSLQYRFLKERI
jgi:uncharacterized protein involved in exopolysaccharide biosynthesis